MPGVALKSTGQRVAKLEAWAFRTDSDLADIKVTLNELPTTIREEVMTYTSPMFEEILNRMATKEDLSALSIKVDGLDLKVDKLEIKMEARMDSMDGRMNAMENSMDSMNGRMNAMEGRMDSMDGKLDLILAKLN